MGTSGGAAIPRSLMEALEQRYGLRIIQGWGMTETSPVGGMAHPPADVEHGTDEDSTGGSSPAGSSPASRCASSTTTATSCRGTASGRRDRGARAVDHRPRTTRPARRSSTTAGCDRRHRHVDERGFFQITDRSKDVIKSGGEWISSVELENLLAGAPDVAEAAVIGIPDEKWTERPLACVVPKGDADRRLAAFLDGKVASWQMPENWTFVDEVPKTRVGKFDKKVLRARYADGDFEVLRTRD